MADNFFALLKDGTVRRIALRNGISTPIRKMFLEFGSSLFEEKEQVQFDGNYKIDEDEVLYVDMNLPESVAQAANNPIGLHVLNLKTDKVKALFWHEGGYFYFQTFDSRKLLQNKNVLIFDAQTYTRLMQDAFVIDNAVNAVFHNNRYFFTSYSIANKIFSLLEFYREATDEDLIEFAANNNISITDTQWFVDNSNTVARKQVTLLQKSNVLQGINTQKIQRSARKFKLPLELDERGRIIFPQNANLCKKILKYLNEQVYKGPITGRHYVTNSNKQFSPN